jgi:hypothetical protein
MTSHGGQKMWNASRFCVSSLRRGHANLLCIVPILVYVLPKQVHRGEQKKVVRKDFFKVSAGVGMVFIKGILRVVKPAFKEQIWFLRLENAQITNLSLIFETLFRAQKCSKPRNKGLRLLETLKKPVGTCRNNLSSSQQHFNLTCVQNVKCICK